MKTERGARLDTFIVSHGTILRVRMCVRMMPYRILWNGIKREGVKASSGLAFGLFYYVPLHRIRYGICWLVQREKLLYTFAPNFSHMGSVHERKKLLSFADVV